MGKDNSAFKSKEQDHTHIDMDSVSKVADDAPGKKTDQQNKSMFSLLKNNIEAFQGFLADHREHARLLTYLILAAGSVAIVIAACVLNFQRAVVLLVISLVTVFFLAWDWMMERYGDRLWEELYPIRDLLSRSWFWMRWIIHVLLLLAVVCWLALDTAKQGTRQLVSFCGFLLFVSLTLLFSKYPLRWSGQTLLWGVGLQFLICLLMLRTTFGLSGLQWLGKQVETFVSFTDVGSEFVFGSSYRDHLLAFQVLPILVFLSTVISILYYIGFMSWLICKLGFIMQVTMGTSPPESMAAAGSIFLGPTDSPLLIRPYISELTHSEIHAVMTGGFAGISGIILGVFISYGIDAAHLLTSSVMSAPASLTVAKLFWPETETPSGTANHNLKTAQGEITNIWEAASHGASSSVGLVATIVVNLIAFMALLAFFDAALSWLGGMLDCPQLSFSLICSYVFMPLSFMMGFSWEDSFIVAELIGMRMFLNEFMAYQKLVELIKRRKAGGPQYVGNVKQYISVHSETIATYVLCSSANLSSLGMTIGVLSAVAPERRNDISSCGLRALIAGCISTFMSTCIAGMLYIPDLECPHFLASQFSNINVTNSSQLVTCCTQLYNSVTVHEPWNVTIDEGFTQSHLQRCCTLTPPTRLNCSSVL